MKNVCLVALAVAVLSLFAAPAAQAQCSGYACPYFNCPWYQLLGDVTFDNGCGWGFSGTAGVTSTDMCGYSGNNVGYISAFMYSHGGTIAQTVATNSGQYDDDEFMLEFFIDTSNMQTGDAIDVYIIDQTASTWNHVDTITSNESCVRKSYTFTSPGWKGHTLQVRFEGAIASSSTIAKFDYVVLWQHT
jgi:hypothetical protein